MKSNNQHLDVGKNIVSGEKGDVEYGFSHCFMDSILRFQFYPELYLVSGTHLNFTPTIEVHRVDGSKNS